MKLCKDTMIQSFNNISFSPERRGEQDFNYYTELLEKDLKELGENLGNYEAKFIDKVMSIYHAQSRCASSMICGPANFNVRQNTKRWDSLENKTSHLWHWRKKYFKAVNRVRNLSPEAELDKLPQEIDELEYLKESFKEIKKCKTSEERGKKFDELLPDFDRRDKDDIIENGMRGYCITSMTTKIRALKKKIEVMKSRIEAKKNQKPVYFLGGSIYIENDRVIIAHDEKPSSEVIKEIKSNGFRWSPKMSNWCRKHTGNARYSANLLLKNVFGGELKCN